MSLIIANDYLPSRLIIKRLQPKRKNNTSLVFVIFASVALYFSFNPDQFFGSSVAVPSPVPFDIQVSTQVSVMLTEFPYPTRPPRSLSTPVFTPTPTPALTPTPVAPSLASDTYIFQYSYYNPALGGVNCAVWSDELQECLSVMASGLRWQDYYRRAVACPPDIALGTIVSVSYPAVMRGEWVCLDRGGAIVDDWIDFLDYRYNYVWGGVIVATLSYPSIPLEDLYPASH